MGFTSTGGGVCRVLGSCLKASDAAVEGFNSVDPDMFIAPQSTLGDVAAITSQVPSQTFEPVVNMPAVFAFLFIAVIFSLLQIRITGVRRAVDRRTEALKTLREIKSIQLSASDICDEDSRPTSKDVANDVARALSEYEDALRNELDMRTIIPGVRIVAPNDPKQQEDDVRAVRQFLDMEFSEGGEIIPVGEGSTVSPNDSSPAKESQEAGMSNGAKAVLAAVALVQILLLVLLSFDPMAAVSSFTN